MSHINRRLPLVLIAGASLLLGSCEFLFMEPVPDVSSGSIFDQVWSFADQEYSFFDFKEVDWAAARETYRPPALDASNEAELFDLLADMLFQLRDGHVNLTSDFDRSRNWQWFLDYPANFDLSVLEREYFTDADGVSIQEYVGDAFTLMEFPDDEPASTDGDVGYIRYSSFGSPVRSQDMDYVIERFSSHAGLIIDLRDNGGGSLSNVFTIAERLIEEPVIVAAQQIKNGPGHEQFTPLEDIVLSPQAGSSTYSRPVVVLTNRLCYSATNYFVTMVRGLENVTVMGDRTGGGGGIPSYTELTNGWILRVSSSRLYINDPSETLSLAERNVEHGVDPEIFVSSTEAELALGVDTILDTAIAELR